MAKEQDPHIVGPVPPQPSIPDWIRNQFEQIENLQLIIIKQQGDLGTVLENINAESVLIWSKVKDLEALASDKVIPELEKIIKTVSKSAVKIDEQVPDKPPPMPPSIGTAPKP